MVALCQKSIWRRSYPAIITTDTLCKVQDHQADCSKTYCCTTMLIVVQQWLQKQSKWFLLQELISADLGKSNQQRRPQRWKVLLVYRADNCHHRHHRWWTFSKQVHVLRRENEILAHFGHFGYFVANLRTFWCAFTRLNNAVVSQNWQISGILVERKKILKIQKIHPLWCILLLPLYQRMSLSCPGLYKFCHPAILDGRIWS